MPLCIEIGVDNCDAGKRVVFHSWGHVPDPGEARSILYPCDLLQLPGKREKRSLSVPIWVELIRKVFFLPGVMRQRVEIAHRHTIRAKRKLRAVKEEMGLVKTPA